MSSCLEHSLRKMKFLLALIVLTIVTSSLNGEPYTFEADWHNYKLEHSKNYGKVEDAIRSELFRITDKRIKTHNNGNSIFQLTHTLFSDMKREELNKYLGIKNAPAAVHSPRFLESSINSLAATGLETRAVPPATLDYRNDTCMPAIKYQGGCGSCWAFSAIAPLEFAQCKYKTKIPVLLSEQQLVDCDKRNYGCSGGWYVDAWNYMIAAHGSIKQSFYPYADGDGTCKLCAQCTCAIGAKVSTYSYVQSLNATAMQVALQNYGPIAVAIAVVDTFYSYSSGVYNDAGCDGQGVNHGVVIVGWGILNSIKYWIVRNSWGSTWGLAGYFLMQRGNNKCNIEYYPAYVVPL